MSKWEIKEVPIFIKRKNKLIPKSFEKVFLKKLYDIKDNPYNSKPLGYKYFREKKIDKWRIYFLIYDDILTVLLVEVSNKKLQQDSIDKIKPLLEYFKNNIENK